MTKQVLFSMRIDSHSSSCGATAANIYHAQESLVAVSLRPLSAKSGNSYYTKRWEKETLHMDDLIRTIEGPKKGRNRPFKFMLAHDMTC